MRSFKLFLFIKKNKLLTIKKRRKKNQENCLDNHTKVHVRGAIILDDTSIRKR